MSDDEDVAFYDSDDACVFDDFDGNDDDGVLNTPNEKGKGVDWSVSYQTFSSEELRAEIDLEIEAIVSVLGVDRNLALVFLLHYRWNRDKLIEQYSDYPSRVLFDAGEPPGEDGISNAECSISDPPKKRLRRSSSPAPLDNICGVCFDEVSDPLDLYHMRCKHSFCRDCWGAYLSNRIKSEGQYSVRCMADKCKTSVSADFIKSIAGDEIYERWQVLLAQSFVSATPSLRFCPSPSCSETVRCSISSSTLLMRVPTVTCSQGHSFCFGCGLEEGHTPVVCKIADRWLSSKDDSGTMQWINANTRKCPKCTHNIEKAGGCNRMICRHCTFQFCWMCLRDWEVHGYNKTVCNSYVEPPRTESMDKAKVDLERWMFYYDRFNNHEVSARLDQELMERTKEKMIEIQQNSNFSWIETHFMQHAVDELTRCRRTLKWTYAMAHFLAFGNKKHMFEDIQADLEKAVEQLSQLIDEPIEDASVSRSSSDTMIKDLRQRVVDKTIYVQKRHEVVLVDVAKGLADGHWDWTVPIY